MKQYRRYVFGLLWAALFGFVTGLSLDAEGRTTGWFTPFFEFWQSVRESLGERVFFAPFVVALIVFVASLFGCFPGTKRFEQTTKESKSADDKDSHCP